MIAKTLLFTALLLPVASIQSVCQESSSNQDQIKYHAQMAQQYLRDQKPDLAIPELKALVALDPGNVEAQGNLGTLLFFIQHDYNDAVPALRAATKLQPDLWKLQALLGLAEEHTSDSADARKDLETSFPQLQDKKLQVQVGLELVGIYTQSGDLDVAAGTMLQLRKAYPENPEVQYAAYRTFSDLSGESMLSLSVVAPDSAQMHQLMAHEEIKEGNTNGAVAQFRKAIAIDPHLPAVHYELAELLNTSQDVTLKKEAEKEYRTALIENPLDEKTQCRLAEIDAVKGNTKQAYTEYSKAVELAPGDSDAKLGLAKTLIEMNQLDKAQALLEQTVQLEPTNAVAHYRLATLYRKKGEVEDAKREVELYRKYKDMKEKLRAVYKDLQVQPSEIRVDEQDEK
ncbi:MAG: tetratricopeptide repeat protein [Terracidiphilus sp.]|jgi:cytochrome c-type biogenesis protein CcmH/NrfG